MSTHQQGIKDYVDASIMAPAIVEALLLWTDINYANYLRRGFGALESVEWFSWFLGEWNVARTLEDGRHRQVFDYLNTDFREDLKRDRDGSAIDRAAVFLRDAGFSAKVGVKKVPGLPLSLVSKIAFLFGPGEYPPCDSLAKSGLNQLRGIKRDGGLGHLKFRTYGEFLTEFNRAYSQMCQTIRNEIRAEWVAAFAKKIGASRRTLDARAFKRKALDNYLMRIGRARS